MRKLTEKERKISQEKSKEKRKKYYKKWLLKNKDKMKEYQREYDKNRWKNDMNYRKKSSEQGRLYRLSHIDELKQYHKEYNQKNKNKKAQYRLLNKEKIKQYHHIRYLKNTKTILMHNKIWSDANIDKIYQHRRIRRKLDINYKIGLILRCRLNSAIKNNKKAGSAVRDLGCSIDFFKKHIELQFTEGMGWDNWGRGNNKWHLDHILPLSMWGLTNREQFLVACNYQNYQPLWAKDNLSKSNKI